MKYSRKAFTMIELVFVIVVLGILSSIAISKMAVTRDDAIIAKGRSQVAAIRNAIILAKNKKMMEGVAGASLYPVSLDSVAGIAAVDTGIFDVDTSGTRLLDYPIYSKDADGHWRETAANIYSFKVLKADVDFTYTQADGKFDCDHTNANCKLLTE